MREFLIILLIAFASIIAAIVVVDGASAAPYPSAVRSNAVLIGEFDNCQESYPCRTKGSKDLDLLMARVVVNGKGPWTRCADAGGVGRKALLPHVDHWVIHCPNVDT